MDLQEFKTAKDNLDSDSNDEIELTLTEDDISNAILDIKKNKAPGPDHLNRIIILEAFKAEPQLFFNLYKKCWYERKFPKLWKQGALKILCKPGKDDPNDPKSYRPLTLLNEMGKVLEKIIIDKITNNMNPPLSQRQYGFVKGKNTVTAIQRLVTTVSSRNEKYAVVLFLDIAGAFNELSWAYAIKAMRDKNIPKHILETNGELF